MTSTIFQNEFVSISLVSDVSKPYIAYYDLKDNYNDTRGFTRNVRGLKRAAAFISKLSIDERLKDDITFSNVTDILSRAKLKPHTYCGND